MCRTGWFSCMNFTPVVTLSLTGRQCEDGGEVSDPTPGRRDPLPDHHTPDLCGQRRQEGDLGE